MGIRSIAGIGLLALAMAATAADATVYRIEKTRRDEITAFTPEGDRFVRGEKIPASRVVGRQVIEASPRGYVLVETEDGQVWLDKLDVQIDPRLPVKAECIAAVSTPGDTTAGIVRGSGGACE